MRIWSVHPQYLDVRGLTALWRETLLAKKVLQGKTRGYRNHPQLERFKSHPRPLKAVETYLAEVWAEADRRGYHFNAAKVGEAGEKQKIPVTRGQLRYEFGWLSCKLKKRDQACYRSIQKVKRIKQHPLFRVISGKVQSWEKIV